MNKKEAKLNYKLAARPMGVFQIRNLKTEKAFVGSSLNLNRIFEHLLERLQKLRARRAVNHAVVAAHRDVHHISDNDFTVAHDRSRRG